MLSHSDFRKKSRLSLLSQDIKTHNGLIYSFLTSIYLHYAIQQMEEMVSFVQVGGKTVELSNYDLLTSYDRT